MKNKLPEPKYIPPFRPYKMDRQMQEAARRAALSHPPMRSMHGVSKHG